MNIKTIIHEGLKDYIENNNAKGLAPEKRPRIQNILAALILAEEISDIEGPPGWKIHQLKGDRAEE